MLIVFSRYSPPVSTYLLSHRSVWFSTSIPSPAGLRPPRPSSGRCVPATMATRRLAQAGPASSLREPAPAGRDPTPRRSKSGFLPFLTPPPAFWTPPPAGPNSSQPDWTSGARLARIPPLPFWTRLLTATISYGLDPAPCRSRALLLSAQTPPRALQPIGTRPLCVRTATTPTTWARGPRCWLHFRAALRLGGARCAYVDPHCSAPENAADVLLTRFIDSVGSAVQPPGLSGLRGAQCQ